MKKKKIALDTIKVKSFITEIKDGKSVVLGGWSKTCDTAKATDLGKVCPITEP